MTNQEKIAALLDLKALLFKQHQEKQLMGLCKAINATKGKTQRVYLKTLLSSIHAEKKDGYWWIPGELMPRLNWVDKVIDSLDSESKVFFVSRGRQKDGDIFWSKIRAKHLRFY